MKGVFDVMSLFFEISQDLVNQRAVFNDQKMRIKDPGVLGPNGISYALLNLE
jgi:hypothetical protein